MSIHVERAITSRIVEANRHNESHRTNVLDRIDFDTVYGVVIMTIVWVGFIVTLWRM